MYGVTKRLQTKLDCSNKSYPVEEVWLKSSDVEETKTQIISFADSGKHRSSTGAMVKFKSGFEKCLAEE